MKQIITIGFILLVNYIFGQEFQNQDKTKKTYKKRNFIYYTPSESDQINGLAIGAWAENTRYYKDSIEVNGLNIEINPVIFFIYARGGFTVPYRDSIEYYLSEKRKNYYGLTVNGFNFSLPGTVNEISTVNGLNITLLTTSIGRINGFSFSTLTNTCYLLNGVSIAGLYNSATKVKGIQIGLINKTTTLKGIQIGLWNKNGKRSLPFINWQFKE